MLEELLQRRAESLAVLNARGMAVITERRRNPRLDFDVTDPAEYVKLRKPPPSGAILIIDKGGALRDHLARLLGERKVTIEWTDSAAAAVRLCEETPVSLVLINTSTPGIDPYGLTAAIKAQKGGQRIAVVLLVGPSFHYQSARAMAAGARGILDKPVADRHLLATVKKLMSMPA